MNDEEIRKRLADAPVPEPIGGHEIARERALGEVRHRFPMYERLALRRRLMRPLVASAAMVGASLVVILAWPEPPAEAEPLPSESQMSEFYDQHETHLAAHLQAAGERQAR